MHKTLMVGPLWQYSEQRKRSDFTILEITRKGLAVINEIRLYYLILNRCTDLVHETAVA